MVEKLFFVTMVYFLPKMKKNVKKNFKKKRLPIFLSEAF